MRPIYLYVAAALVAIIFVIVAVVEMGPDTTPAGSSSASLPREALPGGKENGAVSGSGEKRESAGSAR